MTREQFVGLALVLSGLAGCAPEASQRASLQLGDTAYVEVEPGVRLFTRLVGEGPQTVVIPAGFFLEQPLAGLAEGRRLIFYDMRDRGRSDSVPDVSRVGIRQDVDDLEALRKHFDLERVNLIGWSYLGTMVAMYAFEHPERVERLVQIGPIPPRSDAPYQDATREAFQAALDSADLAKLQELAESGVRESDPQRFYEAYSRVYKPTLFGDRAKMAWYELPPSFLPNEWLHNLEPHIQAKIASLGDYDYRAEAARLNVPVLTIHGTVDLNAPIEGGREWSAAFPQGRFLPVEGTAHLPMVEQPDLIRTAIDVFLRGYWPEGARRIEAGN